MKKNTIAYLILILIFALFCKRHSTGLGDHKDNSIIKPDSLKTQSDSLYYGKIYCVSWWTIIPFSLNEYPIEFRQEDSVLASTFVDEHGYVYFDSILSVDPGKAQAYVLFQSIGDTSNVNISNPSANISWLGFFVKTDTFL